MAVDVGTVRVGVAASDPGGVLASPVATLPRAAAEPEGAVPDDVRGVAALVAERAAVRVVVGLPRHLAGGEGRSAADARAWAALLAPLVHPVPVDLVDERLSTVGAERALAASGVRGPARRAVVDQAAAVEILTGVLDAYRRPPSAGAAPVPDPAAVPLPTARTRPARRDRRSPRGRRPR